MKTSWKLENIDEHNRFVVVACLRHPKEDIMDFPPKFEGFGRSLSFSAALEEAFREAWEKFKKSSYHESL